MWQITQGYSTDPALPAAPLIPAGGFKEKRKGATARKVRVAAAALFKRLAARAPRGVIAIVPLARR